MIITAVRVSKLVSGPGYNNHSVAAEAMVQEGDDPLVIHDKLTDWVDEQLRIKAQMTEYREHRDRFLEEVVALERKKESLQKQCKELEKQLPDDVPF